MSVWVVVPSKRPAEVVAAWAAAWRERGYTIGLWRDPGEVTGVADMTISDPYPGYAQAVNGLVRGVLEWDSACNWIVTGGDDVFPDPNHTADEIARQCVEHFREHFHTRIIMDEGPPYIGGEWATFGVMQCTGDRYGEDSTGSAYIDRVCGSPWMGREFCLRVNQGKGPLWPEYTHMFEDEELFNVAQRLGILWQRRDLVQRHEHWARARQDSRDMPEFLAEVSSALHWRKYKALFEQRKAAGFPGSEPL